MGALGEDHGGHVVGQHFAMHAVGRGQDAIQLGIVRQPVRIGAQERGDGSRVAVWRRCAGIAHRPRLIARTRHGPWS